MNELTLENNILREQAELLKKANSEQILDLVPQIEQLQQELHDRELELKCYKSLILESMK